MNNAGMEAEERRGLRVIERIHSLEAFNRHIENELSYISATSLYTHFIDRICI